MPSSPRPADDALYATAFDNAQCALAEPFPVNDPMEVEGTKKTLPDSALTELLSTVGGKYRRVVGQHAPAGTSH